MNVESISGLYRYKIGIIDLLTKYSGKKAIENYVKATIANVDKTEISAIDQDTYQERFV
jgi:ribosomal protein S5